MSCQKPKKKKKKKKSALTSVFTPIHSTTKMFKRIQEYFQPKIGRKIRIFSLGRKSNLLIKRKECIYPRMGDGWGGGGGAGESVVASRNVRCSLRVQANASRFIKKIKFISTASTSLVSP